MPNLLFLDLETTGLDTSTCEVIEVAYQLPTNIGTYIWSELYKPTKPIPPEISGITNIDNSDVVEKSNFDSSRQYYNLLRLSAVSIAVAHNTDFDLAVLAAHGINFEKSICTHKLAWKLLPDLPNHKLGTLRAYFGIPHGNGAAHRAKYDVEILIQVFEGLRKLAGIGKRASTHFHMIAAMVKLSDQAKLEYLNTWHYGKYKGEKIDPIGHSSYILWTLQNNTSLSENFKLHLQILTKEPDYVPNN